MVVPTVEEIAKLTTPELVKKIKRRVDECSITLSEDPETIEIRDGDTFLNQAVKGIILDMGKQNVSELDLYRLGIDIKCYREMKADLDAALNMTVSKFNTWSNFLRFERCDIHVRYAEYVGLLSRYNNERDSGNWHICLFQDADSKMLDGGKGMIIVPPHHSSETNPNQNIDPLGCFARTLFKQFPYDPAMTDTKNIKRYAINNFISALRNEESPMTSYIFEKLMEIHNMDFRISVTSRLYDTSESGNLIGILPKYQFESEWESRPNIFK